MFNYNLKLFSYNKLFNDFINLDISNKLPSRVLLTGKEGIGKSTFALHLINYFFSRDEATKYNISENSINPESKCYNLINNLVHPNFHFIGKPSRGKGGEGIILI